MKPGDKIDLTLGPIPAGFDLRSLPKTRLNLHSREAMRGGFRPFSGQWFTETGSPLGFAHGFLHPEPIRTGRPKEDAARMALMLAYGWLLSEGHGKEESRNLLVARPGLGPSTERAERRKLNEPRSTELGRDHALFMV